MAFEIRYYIANSYKDDFEFVTEFPCFLGHPVHQTYVKLLQQESLELSAVFTKLSSDP